MAGLRFEWDGKKASSNARKHGVSFEEAETVFSDENALLLEDPGHSESEERFVLLGLSAALRVIVVSHVCREEDAVIRIISARRATARERTEYRHRWSS